MSSDSGNLVGVVGTGIMGRGIAELLLTKGFRVRLMGRSRAGLDAAVSAIEDSMRLAVRRRRLPQEVVEAARGLLEPMAAPWQATGCNIIIEAVTEDLRIKREVFAELAGIAEREVLACTNTSALCVAEIGSAWPDAGRFLGMHFMNPAPASRLVELVCMDETSPQVRAQALEFVKALGLQAIEVGDESGFIVNRLLMLWLNEAARMIEDGVASPQTIDKAVRLALGHPMGPAGLADFIGLDTVLTELETMAKHLGERYQPTGLIRNLVKQGNLGRKSGSGLLGAGGK